MRQIAISLSLIFAGLMVSGCATTGKSGKLEMQVEELQSAVNSLSARMDSISSVETRVEENEKAISEVRGELDEMKYSGSSHSSSGDTYSSKSTPTMKQIQIALRNAGFSPGPADGKKGAQTRKAIRSFKKANGLKPNDKVDRAAWNILKKYLYEK